MNRIILTLALGLLIGTSSSALFPQTGIVLLTPEQAQKIEPDLLLKIRELPSDAPLTVWFIVRPDSITLDMLDELSALGAGIRFADNTIGAISAQILVSDLPKFASLPYIAFIREVGTLDPI